MKKFFNIVLLLILALIFYYGINVDFGESRLNTESISWIKGKVIEVREESLEEGYEKLLLGYQKVLVQEKDTKLEYWVDNYISTEHAIVVKEGMNVIIRADRPEGIEPYYSIYNYDRSSSLILYVILFILLLFLVGRRNGLQSVLALFISIFIIMFF